MFKKIFSLLLTSILTSKVLSLPMEVTLPEKIEDGTLCYLPPIISQKERECRELNGYFHNESIKMKSSGYCEEFATCFLPSSPEDIIDINQCVKFKYSRKKENIYCSLLYSEVPIPDTYSFMETITILDTFYDHFHYQPASSSSSSYKTQIATTTTKISPNTIHDTTIFTKTMTSTKTVPSTVTSTTKMPPIISKTSTKCIPSTTIKKEVESVTEKETITVTAASTSSTINEFKDESISCGQKWAQCGGKGYQGSTCCKSGLKCQEINEYYSFCQ